MSASRQVRTRQRYGIWADFPGCCRGDFHPDLCTDTIESTSKDDLDRLREWVHVQLERHLNLPGGFAVDIALAAIIGTIIAVNKRNSKDNPTAHPYACVWWMSFADSAIMTGFLLIVASAIALGCRMRAEGRTMYERRDARIFAQDLFIALVLAIPFSLLNTLVNWVHPVEI